MATATDWLIEQACTPVGGVALAEIHGDLAVAALVRSFVERAPAGTAVVVEFLTAGHQDRVDEFVSGATPMSLDEVAPAWRDTTQDPLLWEQPGYLAVLLSARVRLGAISILGAEPNVPWATVDSPDDLLPFAAARTSSAVSVASAAAATSPCLLWYGGWHLTRGTGGLIDQLLINQTWSVGWTHPHRPLSPPDQALNVDMITPPGIPVITPFDRTEVERRRSLIKAMLDTSR
jgi:hypothetical protein